MSNKINIYIIVLFVFISNVEVYCQSDFTDSLQFKWSKPTKNDSLLEFEGVVKSGSDSIRLSFLEYNFLQLLGVEVAFIPNMDTLEYGATVYVENKGLVIRIKYHNPNEVRMHYLEIVRILFENFPEGDILDSYGLDALQNTNSIGVSISYSLLNEQCTILVEINFPILPKIELLNSNLYYRDSSNHPELVLTYMKGN